MVHTERDLGGQLNASQAKSLAVFAVIASLAAGCSEPRVLVEEIPSGGEARDTWATKAAKLNGVMRPNVAPAVARVICSDLLPKHDELRDVASELKQWRDVVTSDTTALMAIAIYGYCPEYGKLWEGDSYFRTREVQWVTRVEGG